MLSQILDKVIDDITFPKLETYAGFVAWLKFIHQIMLASSPMLLFGAERAKDSIRDYYIRHAEEEREHALWMAEDLTTLGHYPVIDHAAACIAGAQYYYAEHVAPEVLLGYMAALEFRPMPMEQVETLEGVFGKRAMRTVRYHALNDVRHTADLRSLIDAQDKFGGLIAYNTFATRKMLGHYLGERMTQ